jgi:alkylation response protein AidB-like acyl-CoA dehydrogenase
MTITNITFSSEQEQLRNAVMNFARNELNPGIAERDRTGSFPRDLWEKCAKQRILALPFPEKFGGDGFDFLTTVSVFHALGYACKDSGLVHALASQVICGIQLLLFGDESQKAAFLPDLCSGKLIYAQAITEPCSGSDAFAMQTMAIKQDEQYIVNGTKTMISNGPIADNVIVFAITDKSKKAFGGVSCFIISKETVGFSKGKPLEKMGLRTLQNGELFFNDCSIPGTSLLGRVGQGMMIFNESMEWERTLIPALLLGEQERVLDECVKYAKERSAFGQPIAKFQAVSHKIAAMKVNVELGRLALYNVAYLKNQRKHAALESSIAKLFISESLKQACMEAIQIHGGYGYMTEFEVERELRDSVVSTIYSGTSEMQANIIARLAGL